MAAPALMMFPEKLSHKKFRASLKKEKRKRRRQELARLRDSGLSQEEEEEKDAFMEKKQLEEERLMEIERAIAGASYLCESTIHCGHSPPPAIGQKLHEEWLQREEKAQKEFRIKKEKEDATRKRQEAEERKLKEEWEEQQRKEKEEEEQKLQEKREREEAVQKMLERAESELENGATWQNPEPPTDVRVMEKDRANCPFFSKTGACRFGDRCSRKHNFPTSSPTLLIRSMFTTFGMEQCRRDDYDPDAGLEYSEEETYQQFLDFYDDVLPEFKNVGKVIQFKDYLKCNSVHEENTATSFMCSETLTMNSGKPTETSTCLQIGLAPPLVRTRREESGWATMRTTILGPGGGGAPVPPIPIKGMGKPRRKGEAATRGRNLTNTHPEVERGTVPEAGGEKGTGAGTGAGAAGAGAEAPATGAAVPLGPGAAARGGQVVETELFTAPSPNKPALSFNDCIPYLFCLLHTQIEGCALKLIATLAEPYF
ncbi:U2 small nuclear ribonucleoprotein auxiliary factor 35 kDa subunit-related protein 2 isoform X2 [Erinaceus europaeus]|uniref:U2 small nuclear ribonucleoprotein auxiliary factor 35 kDa subunit-related protein 2 isoform X2 n=1 Tax=Erinaceus europaeus TaxID=9365 RepID=A0ABM3WR05_ERIEU|nr:U2 small nuclear ribonucleoprotein auxiliary factor 35 kDa subunit-related protein 2 isoform X2 [Erinaceus europaeus]